MTVVRLNLSHGTFDEHSETIANVRAAADRVQGRTKFYCPIAIAIDLRGSEIRIGVVEETQVEVKEIVKMNDNPYTADKLPPDVIFIDLLVTDKLRKGFKMFIDDGAVVLHVDDVFDDNITCSVLKGGTLRSYQSLVIPELMKSLNMPFLTDKDKSSLQFACENDIDFVFVPHVECGEWIENVRENLDERGQKMKIFAKVQSRFGVDEIEEIAANFDGIIFAPTMDIESAMVPYVQRLTLTVCQKKMKPCFVTTDAEIVSTEIYGMVNWSLVQGDGVILTRDASEGKTKPIESMVVLQNIRKVVQEYFEDSFKTDDSLEPLSLPGALASAAVTSSITTKASAIIVASESGDLAQLVYFQQPKCEIIAVIKDHKAARQLNILDNVVPLVFKPTYKTSTLNFAVNFARLRGILKPGDTVVYLTTTTMQIHYIDYD